MGRCYEEDKDAENAAKYYQAAIEHGTPDRLEAAERLAALIRENEKLGKPEDADKVIDEMVKADPSNYRVYLVRGHYRSRFNLEGAEDDFQKSLELAPDQPEIYKEMSQLAERNPVLAEARRVLDQHRPFTFLFPTAIDVARQILDNGLAAAPNSVLLYQGPRRAREESRADRSVDRVAGGRRQGDPRTDRAPPAARPDPGRARRHRQAVAAHRGAEGPRGPQAHHRLSHCILSC